RHTQLQQQLCLGGRIKQLRQQPIDIGPCRLLVMFGRGNRTQWNRYAHMSVTFTSLSEEYMSMTRQSLHILSRSRAAPWNMECPARRESMASTALSVPKGVAHRMQCQGCISLSTRVSLRSGVSNSRGTSDMASSGHVVAHRP